MGVVYAVAACAYGQLVCDGSAVFSVRLRCIFQCVTASVNDHLQTIEFISPCVRVRLTCST